MLNKYFADIPCGSTLPLDNPYACSVSMPKLQDVIDYEEEKNNIFDRIKSGYPRIIFNPYTMLLLEYLRKRNQIGNGKKLFLLPSVNALKVMSSLVEGKVDVYFHKNLVIAAIDKTNKKLVENFYSFIKHTGYTIFARQAEDLLKQSGVAVNPFSEERFEGDSEKHIKLKLLEYYNLKSEEDIILANSGMNAIFSVYQSLKNIQKKNGRNIFIQYGWLYIDSIQILKKLSPECKIISDVSSTKELEKFLKENGDQVAGIFTETISNPLIKTPDLPALKKIAENYNVPVLLDNTFATPFNTSAQNYCDIIFESLTKFACGHGDIIMGSAMLPENSILTKDVFKQAEQYIEPVYSKDLSRLAVEINNYEERVNKINFNTKKIVEYLENNDKVKDVFHVFEESNKINYNKISNGDNCYGGVISVVFNDKFSKVYDKINLPKGPSLGTDFTLLMPYTILAHYDLVSSVEGRKYLDEIGLSPDLLRISVGLEPIEEILNQFEKALNSK